MSGSAMGNGTITIFDVAREAGVSTATVSRVANGHANIRPETRQRVEKAMKKLGYVANAQARGLAGGKTNVIGLLVDGLESAYVTQIARGINRAATERGYDVLLSTMTLRPYQPLYVEQLFQGLVEGLVVLLASGFERYLDEVSKRGFPVVLIDHAPTTLAPVVKTANKMGTRSAVEYLAELGHRRIGFITGFLDVNSAVERLEGYKATLDELEIPVAEELIQHGDFMLEGGIQGTKGLLDLEDPPTAIMCSSDLEAFGALQVARERGIRVPQDLSIVGFDDLPEAKYVTPPLTTVRQPMLDMGRMSAELLLDGIGGSSIPTSTVELPTQLVIRESTASPHTSATTASR